MSAKRAVPKKGTAKVIRHSPAACATHPLSIACVLFAMYR